MTDAVRYTLTQLRDDIFRRDQAGHLLPSVWSAHTIKSTGQKP